MSNQIKQLEIEELKVQNKKRNIGTVSSFVVGAIAGYVVSRQKKSKKENTLKFVVAGSLLFGLSYWAWTSRRAIRRKESIRQKSATLEKKPENPILTQSESAITTIVELTPTGTPKPTSGMTYKN